MSYETPADYPRAGCQNRFYQPDPQCFANHCRYGGHGGDADDPAVFDRDYAALEFVDDLLIVRSQQHRGAKAVYFPVSILPGLLQPIAHVFPVTYIFEWLRALHQGIAYSGGRVVLASIFNLGLLALGCYIFSRQLAAAKRSGQLVRNDL